MKVMIVEVEVVGVVEMLEWAKEDVNSEVSAFMFVDNGIDNGVLSKEFVSSKRRTHHARNVAGVPECLNRCLRRHRPRKHLRQTRKK